MNSRAPIGGMDPRSVLPKLGRPKLARKALHVFVTIPAVFDRSYATYIPKTYGHSRRRRAGQNASKPEDPAVQPSRGMFPSSFQRASQLDEARAAVHEENDLSESFRDVLSVLDHGPCPSPTTNNVKARFELDRRARTP